MKNYPLIVRKNTILCTLHVLQNETKPSKYLQGLKLTFFSGASWRLMGQIWSPDCKFWSPTYLIYNLHKNLILNVTLHARKVIIN